MESIKKQKRLTKQTINQWFIDLRKERFEQLYKDFQIRILEKEDVEESFEDIYGLEEEKGDFIKTFEIFNDDTVDFKDKPKGVVLYGETGTGKTMLARALSRKSELPFLYVSGGTALKSVESLKTTFEIALEYSPCILCIDEFEVIGKRKKESGLSGLFGGSDEDREKMVLISEFLTLLDGGVKNKGVFIVGITNHINKIDEAILREGRFDKKIKIGLPNQATRKKWLEDHIEKYKIHPNYIEELMDETQNFSIIKMKNTFNLISQLIDFKFTKKYLATEEGQKERQKYLITPKILDKYLEDNLNDIFKEELETNYFNQEEEIQTAIHETGHAILAYLLKKDGSKFKKVTILSNLEEGYWGYSQNQSLSQKGVASKQEDLVSRVSECLGGYCAELLFSKIGGIGQSGDFIQAQRLTEYLINYTGVTKSFLEKRMEFFENCELKKQEEEDEIKNLEKGGNGNNENYKPLSLLDRLDIVAEIKQELSIEENNIEMLKKIKSKKDEEKVQNTNNNSKLEVLEKISSKRIQEEKNKNFKSFSEEEKENILEQYEGFDFFNTASLNADGNIKTKEEEARELLEWIKMKTLNFFLENEKYKIRDFFKEIVKELVDKKELYYEDLDNIAERCGFKQLERKISILSF